MIRLEDCIIVSAVRIPIGRFGGSLKDFKVYDLGAEAIKAAIERDIASGGGIDVYTITEKGISKVPKEEIDKILY